MQGDWARWGLADDPTTEIVQTLETDRLTQFRLCPEIYFWPTYKDACVLYLSGLYDYSRQLTAFKEVCEALWDEANIIYASLAEDARAGLAAN